MAALVVTVCAVLALGAALSRRVPAAALVGAGSHPSRSRLHGRARRRHPRLQACPRQHVRRGRSLDRGSQARPNRLRADTREQSLHRDGHHGVESLHRSGRAARQARTSSGSTVSARARCHSIADGVLREHDGTAVTGSVLFATGGSTPIFTAGDRVVKDRFFSLVIPSGNTTRLRAFARGCPLEQHGRAQRCDHGVPNRGRTLHAPRRS